MGGLTIVRGQQSSGGLVADRRLYLSPAGKLVEHGSPDAALLLAAGPGDEIPASRAKELSLSVVDGKVVQGAQADPVVQDPPDAPPAEPPKKEAKAKK